MSGNGDAVHRAKEAIGRDGDHSDWQLRPDKHADALPKEAGALKRVLTRNDVSELMGSFNVSDQAAGAAQTRYKRAGHLGLYAATVSTVVGALFLLPINSTFADTVHPYATIVQIASLLLAFLTSRWLAHAKPFDMWMKERAAAEIARVELFKVVTRAEESLEVGEIPLLPLQLEYFRRYQLDVQRRYYRGRGAQHEAALWRNNRWLSFSAWITAFAVLIGAMLVLQLGRAYVVYPDWLVEALARIPGIDLNRIILALGVIASSLYGLGVARSLMNLDERNASRFATTSANLEYLAENGLPVARAAAEAGEKDGMLDFVDRVQQQISSEHLEWVVIAKQEHRDHDLMMRSRKPGR